MLSKTSSRLLVVLLAALLSSGCVSTAIGFTKAATKGVVKAGTVTVKTGGKVVGAAIPDGDEKDEKPDP
ncbi:MAG: hypothetical protein AAF385_03540 [Pseudomonadota bacterium]